MIYSSINNDKMKKIKKLNTKKYRDEFGMFLIDGEHLIKEAYKSHYLKTIILLEGTDIDIDIEKIWVTEKVMKYISELNTPSNIMGVCTKKERNTYGNKIVILDGIQDPGNLGTIIRSCVAFNCDSLLLSSNTVDLYNSKVIRASQGMLFYLNIVSCDILEEIKRLKKDNYKIIGTDVVSGGNIKQLEKVEKFAIIMGNEGNGISSQVKELCDDFVYIEMNKDCESLNVGVATSIILYELNRG